MTSVQATGAPGASGALHANLPKPAMALLAALGDGVKELKPAASVQDAASAALGALAEESAASGHFVAGVANLRAAREGLCWLEKHGLEQGQAEAAQEARLLAANLLGRARDELTQGLPGVDIGAAGLTSAAERIMRGEAVSVAVFDEATKDFREQASSALRDALGVNIPGTDDLIKLAKNPAAFVETEVIGAAKERVDELAKKVQEKGAEALEGILGSDTAKALQEKLGKTLEVAGTAAAAAAYADAVSDCIDYCKQLEEEAAQLRTMADQNEQNAKALDADVDAAQMEIHACKVELQTATAAEVQATQLRQSAQEELRASEKNVVDAARTLMQGMAESKAASEALAKAKANLFEAQQMAQQMAVSEAAAANALEAANTALEDATKALEDAEAAVVQAQKHLEDCVAAFETACSALAAAEDEERSAQLAVEKAERDVISASARLDEANGRKAEVEKALNAARDAYKRVAEEIERARRKKCGLLQALTSLACCIFPTMAPIFYAVSAGLQVIGNALHNAIHSGSLSAIQAQISALEKRLVDANTEINNATQAKAEAEKERETQKKRHKDAIQDVEDKTKARDKSKGELVEAGNVLFDKLVARDKAIVAKLNAEANQRVCQRAVFLAQAASARARGLAADALEEQTKADRLLSSAQASNSTIPMEQLKSNQARHVGKLADAVTAIIDRSKDVTTKTKSRDKAFVAETEKRQETTARHKAWEAANTTKEKLLIQRQGFLDAAETAKLTANGLEKCAADVSICATIASVGLSSVLSSKTNQEAVKAVSSTAAKVRAAAKVDGAINAELTGKAQKREAEAKELPAHAAQQVANEPKLLKPDSDPTMKAGTAAAAAPIGNKTTSGAVAKAGKKQNNSQRKPAPAPVPLR